MIVLVSTTNDPLVNLAREQQLLTERSDDVLFLYVNAPSVIIGRNQLSEAEADLDFCREHQIPVIKRLSGGGTVYHDYGNINYAFLSNAQSKGILDQDFLTPMVDALRSFGIEATIGVRKELRVNGLKISGTAAHVTKGRQLFHGTLLFDTELGMLEQAIRGDRALRGKYVASVPSKVVNLRELIGEKMDTREFLERLVRFFTAYYS